MESFGVNIGPALRNVAGMRELEEQNRMSEMLQGMASLGGSPAEMLEQAGGTALRSGMFNQAEKALNTAAAIRQREAHGKLYQAQALDAAVEADVAKIDQFASIVGMYPDTAAGWEAAKASYLANNPNPSPMEMQVLGAPYRPGIANAIKTNFMTAKDKMMLAIRQQQANTAAGNAETNANLRALNLQLRQQEFDLQKEREDRLRRAGDTKNLPTKEEVEGASSAYKSYLLAQGFSDRAIKTIPPVASEAFARSLANQARQLVGKGMDYDAALEQAIADNADRIQVDKQFFMDKLSIAPTGRATPSTPTAPAPAAKLPGDVTVGGKTYTRPKNYSDAQWQAYLDYVKSAAR